MRSDEKAVRAITGVTAVMLAAKLLAVLRNILQARAFGAGPEMDLFTLANNYSVSLFTTVAHAFCVAAVPIFSQGLRRSREEGFAAANRLISTAMTCCLGLTLLLEGLNLTGLPALLAGEGAPLFRRCFGALLPALPVILFTYLLLALLQSLEHYTLQGSLSLLYSLALCAVLALAGDRLSLPGFALLTAVGWLLQLCMLLPAAKRERYRFRFTPDFRMPALRDFARTGLTTVVTSAAFLFCYLLNSHFAAGFGSGAVSAFYYADKLYEPLTTTLIYSVSIVMFPRFSQKQAQLPDKEYRQYVVYVVKNTLLLILPVSLLFAVFGTPVIRVLFEGGSFTPEDTAITGGIFSMYALGMAGFFMLDLLSKAYFAISRRLTPLLVSLGAIGLCAVSGTVCRAVWPREPRLLAAGTSVSLLAGGLALYVRFARQAGLRLPGKQLFWGTALSLAMGAGVWALGARLIPAGCSKPMLVLLCGGLGALGLLCYLLLMGEMVPTGEILRALLRRKQS